MKIIYNQTYGDCQQVHVSSGGLVFDFWFRLAGRNSKLMDFRVFEQRSVNCQAGRFSPDELAKAQNMAVLAVMEMLTNAK